MRHGQDAHATLSGTRCHHWYLPVAQPASYTQVLAHHSKQQQQHTAAFQNRPRRRPARDAMIIARHFSAGTIGKAAAQVPWGRLNPTRYVSRPYGTRQCPDEGSTALKCRAIFAASLRDALWSSPLV